CLARGYFNQTRPYIDFLPIESLKFSASQPGECTNRNIRNKFVRRLVQQVSGRFHAENSYWRFDHFRLRAFYDWVSDAVIAIDSKVEGDDQQPPKIVARYWRYWLSFQLCQTAKPLIDFSGCDLR